MKNYRPFRENDLDQILLKYIRENQDKKIHLDILANIVRAKWPEWYDSDPQDGRHYTRTRLQSMKDNQDRYGQGKIGNPKYRHYCHPMPKDPLTHLDWEEAWDEFLVNAKKAKKTGQKFIGYNEEIVVEIFDLKMKNNEPNVILRYNKDIVKDFTETNFKEAIIRLNTVAGRMHRPRRLRAKNVVLVGLMERLEFDDDNVVIVTKKEFDPSQEFDELDTGDKEKFIDVIKSLKSNKTKIKGERTVSNLVREARQRSKGSSSIRESRKRGFNLDEEWKKEKEKLTHCEVTGIKFADNFESGPFARSLDCRDPDLDYTTDNVDVVVSIYNLAKNKWPPEVVKEFCIEWYKNIDR